MEPKLTDEAFLHNLDICIQNVQTDYVGPYGVAATYNVYIMTDGIKETRRRLVAALKETQELKAQAGEASL
jgi:hypothetical protein